MNEKLKSTIRHVLTFGGGFIIAKGWITPELADEIIGAIVTLSGAAWALFNSHKADKA